MADLLKTSETLLETPETPLITAGGPSSSEVLNRLREGALHDLAELDRRTGEAAEQLTRMDTFLTLQLSQLATALSSALAELPSTTERWLADFWVEDFVTAATTANVDSTYGQVTLPILSTQDKLATEDSRGDVWVPPTSQVHYAYQTDAPTESQWLSDERSKWALDQRPETYWWRERPSAGYVWVRFQVPANLNANRLANCLILHPFPVLAYDLYTVEYRGPAGVWTSVDLSYLTGWDGTKVAASGNGNARLFFPQSQVTEVRVKLYTSNLWGFQDVRLQHLEFSPSATLVVDFASYSPGTLTAATLDGKDPDALTYLGTQISGTEVTVDLTQTSQNNTPVLTGIEVQA
jgi:hypothetical protein